MFINLFRNFILTKLRHGKNMFAAKSVFSLNNSKELLGIFNKYFRTIIRLSTFKSRVSPRFRMFNNFVTKLFRMYKHHGALYTVKYLKSCHLSIQQKLARNNVRSLRLFEPDLPLPRLVNGLPAVMPAYERHLIRIGDEGTIRMWLSIFSIYRVLEAPGKVKIETITDKFSGSEDMIRNLGSIFSEQIGFLRSSQSSFNPFKCGIEDLQSTRLLKLLSSGPNFKVAYQGYLADALGLQRSYSAYQAFVDYCKVTNSSLHLLMPPQRLLTWLFHDTNVIKTREIVEEYDIISTPRGNSKKPCFRPYTYYDFRGGKLAFLPEPAGKVRVIAIVDAWTQSLLRPLHSTLFSVLRALPNDGTFDQDASFGRVLAKAKLFERAYSVDLSSATDRLPVGLQENLLNSLFGSSVGTYWRRLLTHRPYSIQDMNPYVSPTEDIFYGTGQPMGCLSSWAMLALTHHMILQACAFRVYSTRTWFTDYEILGDDLVIFDTLVYEEYLVVMKELNVQTNPSKSMISHNLDVAEFAKRTGYKGIDVSGLSLKQFISEDSFRGRVTTLLSLGRKGLIKSVNSILNILLQNKVTITYPNLTKGQKFKVSTSLSSAMSFFVNKELMTIEQALSLFVDPSDKEGDKVQDGQLPVQAMLLNCKRLFNIFHSHYVMGEALLPENERLSINALDERLEISSISLLPFVGHKMLSTMRERLKLLSGLVEEASYTSLDYLYNKEGMDALEEMDFGTWSTVRMYCQYISDSIIDYYGSSDKIDSLQNRFDAIIQSSEPSLKDVIDLESDIEAFSMSLSLEAKVDGLSVETTPPFMMRTLLDAGLVPGQKVLIKPPGATRNVKRTSPKPLSHGKRISKTLPRKGAVRQNLPKLAKTEKGANSL
jgi:hypothetical protein